VFPQVSNLEPFGLAVAREDSAGNLRVRGLSRRFRTSLGPSIRSARAMTCSSDRPGRARRRRSRPSPSPGPGHRRAGDGPRGPVRQHVPRQGPDRTYVVTDRPDDDCLPAHPAPSASYREVLDAILATSHAEPRPGTPTRHDAPTCCHLRCAHAGRLR